ncbi:hypothetical protein LDO51_18435 [Providencia alcalifaciens]|uniref:hypothetical protein n=1 Tax=Providencia alcalifaciens TaxID=126385 RepID=UPI001CE1D705|nr:hypothetical protein LDO51_18435 [Providencia alcalifaciens]
MKKVLLSLPLMCSFYAYAGEQNCSADTIAINNFNNFVFAQERPFNDSLKEMNARTTSQDDYINNTVQTKFDNCGALIELTGHEVVRFSIHDTVTVKSIDMIMKKNGRGWEYKVAFRLSVINQDNVENTLLQQKTTGKYLTDPNGKIIEAKDSSYTTNLDKSRILTRADTRFLTDDNGRLSESNRVSTQENDSVKTTYHYDMRNRLIRTQSDSTVEEFTYGDDDRELSNKTIKEFFTTETTVTTSKSWNKFGRCTEAEQTITTLIKDEHGGKDSVYNYHANIKYDYVY